MIRSRLLWEVLKMTIDEAIKHCEEVAEKNETQALRIGQQYEGTLLDRDAKECRECAAEHRQLAEWLTELKEAKRLLKAAVDDINYYVDCYEAHCDECCCDQNNHCHWKHEAEALALIGEDGDTNE
jgi:hypothetical protein